MINGQKNASAEPEVNIEMPTSVETEKKLAAADAVTRRSGGQERSNRSVRRKMEAAQLVLRLACLLSSAMALSMMTAAKQSSSISVYGFSIDVTTKWSFADSFQYVVGVSAAVAVHSLVHLLISTSRFIRKIPCIPSRFQVCLFFAGDQVFAYALMSAGSAASGVTNLNRTGIDMHLTVPNMCKPFRFFCNHVAMSIGFTFFAFFLLAISVVVDVIWFSLL